MGRSSSSRCIHFSSTTLAAAASPVEVLGDWIHTIMLSPDEQDAISNTAEGLAKGALAPLHDLLRDLAAPGVSEIGQLFGLNVRYLKISRAISLAKRVNERLEPLGLNRRPIALKLLLSSFESAAVEDEDELQELWATLIT